LITGLEGISNKLKAHTKTGISALTFNDRTHSFGNNMRDPIKAKSFCKIFREALDDFMLKVLIVAATGSLAFEYIGSDPSHYSTAWFDGAAIYLAVLIVSGFGSIVDWRKEKEFVKRSQASEDAKFVTVTRQGGKDGESYDEKIHINFLHVGDIVHLNYGLVIPVDGLVINSSQLQTNEAAMTGESDERRKEPLNVCLERRNERGLVDLKKVDKTESHFLPSCIMLSGTDVAAGTGKMMTLMVGENSALGEIMKKLEVRP